MKRWLIGLAAAVVAVRIVGGERVADVVRSIDRRLDLFSPRGAGLYARIAPRLLAPLYRAVAADVAAAAPGAVLDVGTGPGALAIEIARRLPAGRVVGVDLAPEMLATAGGRAAEAEVGERVIFQVADAAALPIADRSFDIVVSTLSLHHWSDPKAVLNELHRVLRPGGALLIYDLRFSYSRRQFAAFVSASPFADTGFAYTALRLGRIPVSVFARYALRRRARKRVARGRNGV